MHGLYIFFIHSLFDQVLGFLHSKFDPNAQKKIAAEIMAKLKNGEGNLQKELMKKNRENLAKQMAAVNKFP